jgi:hypothetical protein
LKMIFIKILNNELHLLIIYQTTINYILESIIKYVHIYKYYYYNFLIIIRYFQNIDPNYRHPTVNCPSEETEVTSTSTGPVGNVVITTKGLQDRNNCLMDGRWKIKVN